MEEKNNVEQLLTHVKDYAETRFDLVVLTIQDKVSDVVSSMVSYLVLAVFLLIALLLTSIGAAMGLSDYFNSSSIGFFCVAGFYLILSLIAFTGRKSLIKMPIINAMI